MQTFVVIQRRKTVRPELVEGRTPFD